MTDKGIIAYHGGAPGLRVGQRILPPSKTGSRCASDYGAASVHDRAKVYVTTELSAAVMWASLYPRGDGKVYKVETVGPLAHDPDCNTYGLSYTCDEAIIRARVRVKRKTLSKIRKHLFMDEAKD